MIPSVIETNLTASVKDGTSLAAHNTPHTEASGWTLLISALTGVTQEVVVRISDLSGAGADTGCLLDLAYGDGGGGSEVAFINDLLSGEAPLITAGNIGNTARVYRIPYKIVAGKSLSGRIRATVSDETAVIAVASLQTCQHIDTVGGWVTYGANTAASTGTAVPAKSSDYGAWTEIGTTSEAHNLFLPGYDSLGDTSILGNGALVRLGFGATAGAHANDAAFATASGTIMSAAWMFSQGSSEAIAGPFPATPLYVVVGSGVRLHASIAGVSTENRGITIYGATGTVVAAGGLAQLVGPSGRIQLHV